MHLISNIYFWHDFLNARNFLSIKKYLKPTNPNTSQWIIVVLISKFYPEKLLIYRC